MSSSNYLKSFRENSYLDAKNMALVDTYDKNPNSPGELKLKSISILSSIFNNGDIYKEVKGLKRSNEEGWDAQIAGILGLADVIKEKLNEYLEADKYGSGWAWKAGAARFDDGNVHIENYASPLSVQINHTIEVQQKMQENQLKLEAVEDFIKYAESLLEEQGD